MAAFNLAQCAKIEICGSSFAQTGPLLITHFGFSGPAALKLSAWAARYLYEKNYEVELAINYLPHKSRKEIGETLGALKRSSPHKTLWGENPFQFPKNFWKLFLERLRGIYLGRLNDLSLKHLEALAENLQKDVYHAKGKTTNKEEFVTCGGVTLKEVDFRKMESKLCPNLYFAGEILDIDGVTGGFNFQNGWTTGFIAGSS